MNRTLHARRGAAISLCSWRSPARAAAPLVVGSVRDQHGAVIAGAIVTAERRAGADLRRRPTPRAPLRSTVRGSLRSLVSCRYCAATQVAPLTGEPVVAIVRRYEALCDRGAYAAATCENLPYAHVESSVALRPFTLLAQSTAAYPGSTLSDRGLSPSGSLADRQRRAELRHRRGQSPYDFHPGQLRAERAYVAQREQRVSLRRSGRRWHRLARSVLETARTGRSRRSAAMRSRARRSDRTPRRSRSARSATTRNRVSARDVVGKLAARRDESVAGTAGGSRAGTRRMNRHRDALCRKLFICGRDV